MSLIRINNQAKLVYSINNI